MACTPPRAHTSTSVAESSGRSYDPTAATDRHRVSTRRRSGSAADSGRRPGTANWTPVAPAPAWRRSAHRRHRAHASVDAGPPAEATQCLVSAAENGVGLAGRARASRSAARRWGGSEAPSGPGPTADTPWPWRTFRSGQRPTPGTDGGNTTGVAKQPAEMAGGPGGGWPRLAGVVGGKDQLHAVASVTGGNRTQGGRPAGVGRQVRGGWQLHPPAGRRAPAGDGDERQRPHRRESQQQGHPVAVDRPSTGRRSASIHRVTTC
jgi:hypothetical protein